MVRDAGGPFGPCLEVHPWGGVFRFVAVCPDGGLVHRRNAGPLIGRGRWSGRRWGVMLSCCDDRPESGGGGASCLGTGAGGGADRGRVPCGSGCRLPAGAGAGAAGWRFPGIVYRP